MAKFSVDEFEAAGLDAEDRYLIEFMADQEVGHATLISNMLGRELLPSSRSDRCLNNFVAETAPKQCNYTYPFETVRDFVDFCQKVMKNATAIRTCAHHDYS